MGETPATLREIADHVMAGRGMAHKTDIADVVASLGLGDGAIKVGDDCAAIPDGDGWLLFAIEGFVNDFVEADPRFAGYCGVMVNLSDIAAMGGRPIAVVDAIWARNGAEADPLLDGLREASAIYGVPIVGGHTNTRTERGQLAVAILGRAKRLITSFDARGGDVLIAAVDLRGRFREPYLYWDAATGSPAERLRGDLALLPDIAEASLVTAGKDISMAGLIGTAMMLLESSGARSPHRRRCRAVPAWHRHRTVSPRLPKLRLRFSQRRPTRLAMCFRASRPAILPVPSSARSMNRAR